MKCNMTIGKTVGEMYTNNYVLLVARGREREIENSKSFGIVHRKARKTTFQRRDKYFFCMYCINNDLKFTIICFQKFQICRFEFRGFRPPGRHRVSRVSEKTRSWESDSVDCRFIVFVTL